MRLQDSQANCGPLAVRNALLALGIARSTEECETMCRVTATHGTRHRAMVRALGSIEECRPFVIDEARARHAMLVLDGAIRDGRPVVLLVDAWSHYVAVVGALGRRYLVADSADSELVISHEASALCTRWGYQGTRRPFWGVVL